MTDETMLETAETTAPVEQAAPEAAPVEVEAPTETPEKPDDAGEHPKPRGWVSSRIKELSDDRNYWREMALQRSQGQEPPQQAPQPEQAKIPKLEDFQYDEAAYQAAVLDFAARRAEEAVDRRLTEREQRTQAETREARFQSSVREFAKAHQDFDVDNLYSFAHYPVSAPMAEVIKDSESPGDLLYWIGQNREQAEKIARLPPHLAARELGRVEARLELQRESAKRPSRNVTQAPPPTPTVDEGSAGVEKSPDDMTMNEWMKWREKQLKRKGR